MIGKALCAAFSPVSGIIGEPDLNAASMTVSVRGRFCAYCTAPQVKILPAVDPGVIRERMTEMPFSVIGACVVTGYAHSLISIGVICDNCPIAGLRELCGNMIP